ncbi:uncharacterized protein LOC131267802 isoform X3 [Anopheles coustani]|uniref:uncharacterized protein LOC131267802 isoform X3 n=1 Tax=Anopheles coustani TaxID=139045 RepID=UPI00265821E1|nr:uncharacterized protein LOC131267802 isoform X3 [Anopheles coustani]
MAKKGDQRMDILFDEWSELRDIYRRNWPKHEFAFYLLQNYIQWKSQEQTLNVNIFSLNGNWRNDGTFVLKVIVEEIDGYGSYLIRLLKLLEWEKLSEISMDYLGTHHMAVTKVINDNNLLVRSSNMANYYFMAKEQALAATSLPLPEGFSFARLTPTKHLDYVYNQWPLRSHISYEAGYGLLNRLLLLNESVGLFDAEGVLVSWCLSDQTGAHSDLQTVDSHCRKGYGRLVVMELAKRLARNGSDSKAYVLQENSKSVKLFESIGFHKIQNLHWVVINGKEVKTPLL